MTNPAHQPSPAIVELQKKVAELEKQNQWLRDEIARLWEALNGKQSNHAPA